jgi:hypothetical protein
MLELGRKFSSAKRRRRSGGLYKETRVKLKNGDHEVIRGGEMRLAMIAANRERRTRSASGSAA